MNFAAFAFRELLDHREDKHTVELKEQLPGQNKQPTSTIPEPKSIKCDQCAFSALDVPTFISHIRNEHSKEKESCPYCEHVAKHREDLKDHVYDKHSDILMLQSMAQQMDTISKSFEVFESFKGELTNVLKSIFDNEARTLSHKE